MTVSYRSAISVVELVVYLPALFSAAYISFRHGFGRNAGWVFLVLFALIRIIGSCCQIQVANKPSKNLYIATAIISSIGLSPLLLTTLGLLSRVLDRLHANSQSFATRFSLRPAQIVTLVGLILCIVGGVNTASDDLSKISTLTKVGVSLFLVVLVAICLVTIYIATRLSQVETGERRLVLAVAISLPFLCVRLIYSALVNFANQPRFNSITGSVTLWLVMAVLEELVIVFTYLATGLLLKVISKNKGPPFMADQPAKQSDRGRVSNSSYLKRGGLIGLLIRSISGKRRQSYDNVENHELSTPNRY